MRAAPETIWGAPYTEAELDAAQARFGFLFPPDLRALLLEHRLAGALDWTRDHEAIAEAFAWPYEGLLFDVGNNGLWWPEWGPRPDRADERAAALRRAVDAAPRLIPVLGHRYMPETPGEAGNPLFSVHQADVIVYGIDLSHYLQVEFGGDAAPFDVNRGRLKTIPFWSELVEREGGSTRP
ncbi:SMI1/KNR4 family protein [Caulobacter sp. 602-2]|uniref:SMI1/KNR4 family protein n=1 Tax=Caulobacter sp. 602-2 TaxID=2710887 RepID=A0A6G4QWY1_9CAUL|nr:SMI1/KNR4 family protein [Caulobacter sp. 602-2]NGM50156.1 SMI1/KNR4 family protein [Caulobacter sp. 602-2]